MQSTNDRQLTPNDEEAIRLFRSLVEQRSAGTLPAAASLAGGTLRLPRVRLAGDVDLSKAKPSCSGCHGTGLAGHQVLRDESGEVRVPVICRCVVKAGGVRPDVLDGMGGGAE